MAEEPVKAGQQVPANRLRVGAAIFVTGQLAPLAIPLVTNSSLPATWKSVLSGVLLLGVPELGIVLHLLFDVAQIIAKLLPILAAAKLALLALDPQSLKRSCRWVRT